MSLAKRSEKGLLTPDNCVVALIDHAETISDRNIARTVALGGGIAVQHRMAIQGEYFVKRYGAEAAKRTPPVRRMLEMGACRGGYGRNTSCKLQSLRFTLLAHLRSHGRRNAALWRGEQDVARGGAAPLYKGEQLVLSRGRCKGIAGSRSTRRLRCSYFRLFFRTGAGDQGPEICSHGRRWRSGLCVGGL
jgi:hypothetical protein